MKKLTLRALVVVLLATTVTSCYGPFRLTTKLHAWNKEVSDNKWGNELVSLGLTIIPVYEICALADVLVINSIEFWTGNNPIAMKAGEVETSEAKYAGKSYKVTKRQNSVVVSNDITKEEESFQYFPEEGVWYHMNDGEKVMAVK